MAVLSFYHQGSADQGTERHMLRRMPCYVSVHTYRETEKERDKQRSTVRLTNGETVTFVYAEACQVTLTAFYISGLPAGARSLAFSAWYCVAINTQTSVLT